MTIRYFIYAVTWYKERDKHRNAFFLFSGSFCLGIIVNIQIALIENTQKYSVTHRPVKLDEWSTYSESCVKSHKYLFVSVPLHFLVYWHKAAWIGQYTSSRTISRIHIIGNDVVGWTHGIIDVIFWYLPQETGEIKKKKQFYKLPQGE